MGSDPTLTQTKIDLLAALARHTETIVDSDALHVLVRLAERLAKGRRAYGPLNLRLDPRNWKYERLEESLDRAIYIAFEDVAAVLQTTPPVHLPRRASTPFIDDRSEDDE